MHSEFCLSREKCSVAEGNYVSCVSVNSDDLFFRIDRQRQLKIILLEANTIWRDKSAHKRFGFRHNYLYDS